MTLKEATEAFKTGTTSKGIRRKTWEPDTWLKLNDYGCQDDLIYTANNNRSTRGYTPNILDITAEDWEVVH